MPRSDEALACRRTWHHGAVTGAPVYGWVASFPQARANGTSFVMATTVAGASCVVLVYAPDFDVHYGDSLAVLLRPATRRGRALDPGYLLGRGVDASARASEIDLGSGSAGSLPTRWCWRAHRWLRLELASHLGYAAAVPLGLVVAERGAFGNARRKHFQRLGIAHLIALSGFHLGLVGAAVLLVLRRIRFRSGWVIAPVLLVYVAVVGDVHSLRRALVMALVIVAAVGVKRPVVPMRALALAALALSVARPTVLESVGFQLSVAATIAVLFWVQGEGSATRRGWRRFTYWSWATVRLGAFVQAALVPLLLLHFGEFSAVAPLATLIFVAPVTVLLAGGLLAPALSQLPGVGPAIYFALDEAARAFDFLLAWCARMSPPPLALPAPDIVVYYIGFAVLFHKHPGVVRRVVGMLLIALSFISFS